MGGPEDQWLEHWPDTLEFCVQFQLEACGITCYRPDMTDKILKRM